MPGEFEPNEVTRLLRTMRGSGVDLFDLAETNPVRLGLTTLSAEIGAALLEGASASYEPDPRGLSTAREAIVAYYRDRSSAVAGCSHGSSSRATSRVGSSSANATCPHR